ncbi:hypothetical protein BVRB_010720 [Beta vulgaris subsp. vulgaris]|uniref:Uncharacterized protein n=1 Tax=Beta vulgaris subsp. vulgaris TaxID=3555 RepID=A0A0J8B5R6_BETVV|nr:hypothetical protein BVRB_010720 [Beta vulgaris subsp. vulgaris]
MVSFASSEDAHFAKVGQFCSGFIAQHLLVILANGFASNWSSKSSRLLITQERVARGGMLMFNFTV